MPFNKNGSKKRKSPELIVPGKLPSPIIVNLSIVCNVKLTIESSSKLMKVIGLLEPTKLMMFVEEFAVLYIQLILPQCQHP